MKFDFIGKKKIWFAISAVVLVISIAAIVINGLKFGIEFTGGTEIIWKFDKKTNLKDVRTTFKKLKIEEPSILPSEKNTFFIRTKSLNKDMQLKVYEGIKKQLGGERLSIQAVGAAWGEQITNSAITALSLSILAILVYISVRFDFKMAVSAVIALIHDILITIGVYALVGRMVTPSTIAALLTILGYSLYDTIVVFHRILENSSKLTKMTYSDVVNESVNEVLVRSINTSVTTLLPIAAILTVGGETLKDFAFALFVGIVSGAYSSIFNASPILAVWKEREPKYVALRKRLEKKKSI